MTGFEIERKIDSWLHCRVTIPLKTGSNPFSALNDRANDRYEASVSTRPGFPRLHLGNVGLGY